MYTNNNVLVSINCIAYNHEPYIHDALESFLMQKTNFRYEILVHDDASTDKTADVIKMYEKKYPGVIFPIYQRLNQYSRGVNIVSLNLRRAQGKYIAICEGDDYWTDPLKLQIQVDYMEDYPRCSLCTHSAYIVSENRRKIGKVRPSKRNAEFDANDIIVGGGDMIATNSMLFPFEKWKKCPEFYKIWSVHDYPLAIYLSTAGDVHYIDKPMSAYRTGIPGQWTAALRNSHEKFCNHIRYIDRKLEEVDKFTGFKYSNAIKKRIRMNHFYLGDLSILDNPLYRDAYSSLRFNHRIKVGLQYRFPSLYNLAKKIKGTL